MRKESVLFLLVLTQKFLVGENASDPEFLHWPNIMYVYLLIFVSQGTSQREKSLVVLRRQRCLKKFVCENFADR